MIFLQLGNCYKQSFQCLQCDNQIDGPGCGEFSQIIPLQECKTFCYFAIIRNYTTHHKRRLLIATRAIRDCSTYSDIEVETETLLETKIPNIRHYRSLDIVTIKRCTGEQCNNEFYLKESNGSSTIKITSCSYYYYYYYLLTISLLLFYSKR
ncbi:unnamed protein product [Didymodactylos carnosus]|uniref:Uncharacterized protein n=1 Tax=Didymodactylos carnosus TaxID=1234261 RepID=A0A814ATC1_9BILA|nr:unnamed protein product [Didymodactylos carnosus]CAF0919508.1 unnamed protein product [Didymodactylos carnosus]CAF3646902.1 unnamed protein product [Didymodactylos carnosus]CAF3699057.1 unnamed protein product [Didymodactylos carnosus]